MGNDVKSYRSAGRITSQDHVRRVLAESRNKITDRFNTLVELMRVHLVRGESVLNDKNGKVFFMLGKVLCDLPAKF